MCKVGFVPVSGALLAIFLTAACQPGDEIEDECIHFADSFESEPVDLSSLGSDFLSRPLADTLKRLEAGYDASCEIGGIADIYIQCPRGNDPRPRKIIAAAPVIATDPEGFTVVIISLHDHRKLEGQDLFWAKCDSGA